MISYWFWVICCSLRPFPSLLAYTFLFTRLCNPFGSNRIWFDYSSLILAHSRTLNRFAHTIIYRTANLCFRKVTLKFYFIRTNINFIIATSSRKISFFLYLWNLIKYSFSSRRLNFRWLMLFMFVLFGIVCKGTWQ